MSPQAVAAVQGGVPPVIGITLFTEYVLPFELVGILLLVALLKRSCWAASPKKKPRPSPARSYSPHDSYQLLPDPGGVHLHDWRSRRPRAAPAL
ncbi:MAG: NADH-quinone oxidoreductase subunit J [Caldilineaceae bacterium]